MINHRFGRSFLLDDNIIPKGWYDDYTNGNRLVSLRFPLRVIQYGITQLLEVDLKNEKS